MKIFITGSRGLLGGHITSVFRERGLDVIAPTRTEFDITKDNTKYLESLNLTKDDIVLNLAAYTNVKQAEETPGIAFDVNTAVEWLLGLPCKIFHMSTDYVYSGSTQYSKETDPPEPFNIYGHSKSVADSLLLRHEIRDTPELVDGNVRIIRTSFKPIKWPYPMAFGDMYTNAETVDRAALRLAQFILLDPPGGIFNVGGPPITVYQLAKKNNPFVQSGSVKDVSFLMPDVTMDLNKYHSFIHSCRKKNV